MNLPGPRYRVVRSGHQWVVLDGRLVVGVPTECLLVADCAAETLNRADRDKEPA